METAQGWRDGKRAEWKGYDPRFMTAINMIKDGVFGDKEYFQVQPCYCTCSSICRRCYSGKRLCMDLFPFWKTSVLRQHFRMTQPGLDADSSHCC